MGAAIAPGEPMSAAQRCTGAENATQEDDMAGSERRIKDAAKKRDQKAEEERRTVDRKLDEALEESFPGSDPVSISRPKPSRHGKDPA